MSKPDGSDPFTRWGDVAMEAVAKVSLGAVEALWRALNYLSAAQLYLQDNLLLERPLEPGDVKENPSGHWGVCPPTNLVLAHLAPVLRLARPGMEVHIVHGAGHAGPSAFAFSYLTGELGRARPRFRQTPSGLRALVSGFPHGHGLGSEITPGIPGQRYMGGQLGPALAFGYGTVLDAPHRLTAVLVGDGECETGLTAATWLGARALRHTGNHGAVLPVVLLNGLRQGGPSLLAGLSPAQQREYFRGLGWHPIFDPGTDNAAFRSTLMGALAAVRPVGDDQRPVMVVVTLPKGATGPERLAGRAIIGTPRVHKTPLHQPRQSPPQLAMLDQWLRSYRPGELLTGTGAPTTLLRAALPVLVQKPCYRERRDSSGDGMSCRNGLRAGATGRAAEGRSFGVAVADVLRRFGDQGHFRVFSPDELASNRLALTNSEEAPPEWLVEILNEELCHAWLQGYVETGRNALFVTYEAFAVLNTSQLHQHLKTRRISALHWPEIVSPSINYLLTSLGWDNCYSHQNPGLLSSLLELEDPNLRVFTPADAARAAADLEVMLSTGGRCHVLLASKHPVPQHPLATLDEEIERGLAVWPHLSDPGPVELVLVSVGDVPGREMSAAVHLIRRQRPSTRIRYVHVNDLTVLAHPSIRPGALTDAEFSCIFGDRGPVLLAALGYPAAVHNLLWRRRQEARRWQVLGYRDPGQSLSPGRLLRHCTMDAESLAGRALGLLATEGGGTW
jgi:xylulose-5-phosphate/fructose-6-phosphate phosphoketolase